MRRVKTGPDSFSNNYIRNRILNRSCQLCLMALLVETAAPHSDVLAADPAASILPGVPPKSIASLEKIDAMPTSELRGLIELYQADLGSVERTYPVRMSHARNERLRKFYIQWLGLLAK